MVGRHYIFLSYQGHSAFHIDYLRYEIFPLSFPTWHSESLGQRKAVAYTMTLTEDPTQALEITVPQEMSHYMKELFGCGHPSWTSR